jgi:hypothetical protein
MGKHRKKSKKQAEYYDPYPDMDGDFAYIAGTTSGGAPYGVTWKEVGIDADLPLEEKVRRYTEQNELEQSTNWRSDIDDEELPF